METSRVNTVLVTNATGANTGTSIATIVDGDILVLDAKFGNLTGTPTPSSAADNHTIYLAKGIATGKAIFSDPIIAGKIKSWKKVAYLAPAEKVEAIGYTGSAGALSMANSTTYRLRINFGPSRHATRAHRPNNWDFHYTSAASADNYDAANYLAKEVNKRSARESRMKVLAEVISDGTITELTMDATVINGSTVVAATAHSLAVGTQVEIRGVQYKVATVIDANSFNLDRIYTGASETIAVASTVNLIGTMASVTAYGLRLTGVALSTRSVDLYEKLTFTSSLAPVNGVAGSEETTVVVTNMTKGSGYWEQVRDMEFLSSRRLNNTLFPVDTFSPVAASSYSYNLYVLEHYTDSVVNMQAPIQNPVTTILAFHNGATTKSAAIEAILDSWLVGAGVPAV